MAHDVIRELSLSLTVLSSAAVLATLTKAARFRGQQCVNPTHLGLASATSGQARSRLENVRLVGYLSLFGLI